MSSGNLNTVDTNILVDGKECDYINLELDQKMAGHHVFKIGVSFRHEKASVWEETSDEIINRYLGKQVAIEMKHIQTGDTNEFLGLVTDIEIVGLDGDKGTVILYGGSPTIALDRDPGMASFVDYNLQNIVAETIENTGVKVELANNPELDMSIPYVARYNETSYTFLSRILAAFGEWFYYDGKKLVVGNPHNSESTKVSFDIELSEVRIKAGIRNLNVELYDYNPAKDDYMEDAPPQNIDGENLYMKAVKKVSESFYPTSMKLPADHAVLGEKDIMATTRTYHSRNYSKTSVFSATCKTCAIKVGDMATAVIPTSFENVSFKDLGRFRILEVHHRVEKVGHYENTFTGVAGLTEALPSDHIIKPIALPEPATVIANDDPLNQGRVKVRYMWQKEEESTNWIRVQTPDAGKSDVVDKNRGFVFIPEVNDQVMVGFQYGDPSRPYVAGSLFHGENSKGATEKNTVRSIITRSGSILRFTDSEDENTYKIELQYNDTNGIVMTVKENEGTMTIQTSKDIFIKAPELIQFEAKKIVMLAEEAIQAKAEDKIEIVAENTVHLESSDKMELKAKNIVQEAENEYSAKSKSIVAKSDSSMALDGGSKLDIKGGTIKMN